MSELEIEINSLKRRCAALFVLLHHAKSGDMNREEMLCELDAEIEWYEGMISNLEYERLQTVDKVNPSVDSEGDMKTKELI